MAGNNETLVVHIFPCLKDNYGFLVHDLDSGQTTSIDTPDAAAISRELTARRWALTHIFNTHHHHDHAGGNLELKEKYNCTIVGAAKDAHRIPGIDVQVRDGDVVYLGAHGFRVIETPGHTIGHIVYNVAELKLLFSGDTLFSGGCGRLFEGTAEQMWNSLQRIRQLPEDTRIYCAHEYTLDNLEFARNVDAGNPELEGYYTEALALRKKEQSTIPTTLERELKINPFLRPATGEIAKNLCLPFSDELTLFTELRRRKDNF